MAVVMELKHKFSYCHVYGSLKLTISYFVTFYWTLILLHFHLTSLFLVNDHIIETIMPL